MESSEDKQWAKTYLLDPLNAPEPSEETGPGTSHVTTAPPINAGNSGPPKPIASSSVRSSRTPSEKTAPSVSVRSSNNPYRNSNYPSPPQSASPATERFPNFSDSTPNYTPQTSRRTSQGSTQIPTSTGGIASTTTGGSNATKVDTRPRRTSSLSARHPGDQSHRPLDMLRHNELRASRSPHLRRKNHVGADSIDSLDNIAGAAYHHEGPYDAMMLARNLNTKHAPLEAVAASNAEALRATPREKVMDSLDKHYPLDGVAMVPPGQTDRYGRMYRYKEGTDMMREENPEGGAYKRWPGVTYLPDDLKGKGEPSYSLEKALKSHQQHGHRRGTSEGIEMQGGPRSSFNNNNNNAPARRNTHGGARPALQTRSSSAGEVSTMSNRTGNAAVASGQEGESYRDWEHGVKRSESGAARLRKRMGSLRLRNKE